MSLDRIISDIEGLLLNKQYDTAIKAIEPIRANPGYKAEKQGYLVDYALGHAMLMRQKDFTLPEIDKIIEVLVSSLKLNPLFAENHLMLGHAYKHKSDVADSEIYAKQSLYYFDNFIKARPELADMCNSEIKNLKEKFNLK